MRYTVTHGGRDYWRGIAPTTDADRIRKYGPLTRKPWWRRVMERLLGKGMK